MCGLVAMVGLDRPVDPEALARATAALEHRGPDGTRTWIAADRAAGLGHTRLAVIDLAGGTQPIASEDGTCVIAVNGELYDHQRLRRTLEARGHRFATRSDSEVALHLYEDHGPECLAHLRGEFALLIWDARLRRIFAARDRFGIKPLYYMRSGGLLLFASEAKAFAAAGHRLRWDAERYHDGLFGCAAADRTLFAGVQQVPPGHYLLAGPDAFELRRYWDADYPVTGAGAARGDREWVDALREAVQEAVQLRMQADVPVGCLVSGGLDSSAALGIARRCTAGPLAAFTVAFDRPEYDESEVARETARWADAEFHPVPVTDADFAAVFADAVWHAEALIYNGHAPARFLLARAVRRAGYKVVLAGEGADELGAGYAFLSRALDARPGGRLARAFELGRRLLARSSEAEQRIAAVSPGLVWAGRLIGFPRDILDYMGATAATLRGLLAPGHLRRMEGRDPFRNLMASLRWRDQLAGRPPVKQLLYLWLKTAFATYVLGGERMDMAHGLELRLPYLDHRLFELARDLPPALYLRDGHQKWVLREALAPFVTPRVRHSRKQPFVAPPSCLRRSSPLYELAQDTVRGAAMDRVPFLDSAAARGLMDRLSALDDRERSAYDPVVLLLLSTCVLQERFGL